MLYLILLKVIELKTKEVCFDPVQASRVRNGENLVLTRGDQRFLAHI
jgi:hypothetical protein